jgi:HPr kinase/phosphorylase
MYDRFGLDNEMTDILGINIPTITIPVRPGRNLAVILEIAAMNNHQKKMGFNTAEDLNNRLMNLVPQE